MRECNICKSYARRTLAEIMCHIREVHPHFEGKVKCIVSNCPSTLSTYESLRHHMYKNHKEVLKGKCKRWTLDRGLDHGLDRGPDFATEGDRTGGIRSPDPYNNCWDGFQFACVSVQNPCIPVPTSILLNIHNRLE